MQIVAVVATGDTKEGINPADVRIITIADGQFFLKDVNDRPQKIIVVTRKGEFVTEKGTKSREGLPGGPKRHFCSKYFFVRAVRS